MSVPADLSPDALDTVAVGTAMPFAPERESVREIVADALADARRDDSSMDDTPNQRRETDSNGDEFGPPKVTLVAVGDGTEAVDRLSTHHLDGVETVTVDTSDLPIRESVAATVADADLVFIVGRMSKRSNEITTVDATASVDDTTATVNATASVADAAAADTPVVAFCRAAGSVRSDDSGPATRERIAALSKTVDTTLVASDDERLAAALTSLATTITQPSLVGLDYGALYGILATGGVGLSVVTTVPPDRRPSPAVADATTRGATPPGLDAGHASGAFVHFAGGPSLTLRTAERVFETATRRLDRDATTAWSADTHPASERDRLRVTCLYTGVAPDGHE